MTVIWFASSTWPKINKIKVQYTWWDLFSNLSKSSQMDFGYSHITPCHTGVRSGIIFSTDHPDHQILRYWIARCQRPLPIRSFNIFAVCLFKMLILRNVYERTNLCVIYIVHLSILKLPHIDRAVIQFTNIYLCITFDHQRLTDIIMYCMWLAVNVSPKK